MALTDTLGENSPPAIALANGLFMVGLAVLVFALRPGQRLNQALALVLFIRGLMNTGTGIGGLGLAPESQANDSITFVVLLLPFTLLYFGYEYRVRGGVTRRRPLVPWLLLAAAIAVQVDWLSDHALFVGRPGGDGARTLMQPLYFGVYAALSTLLLRDALALRASAQRSSLLLVSAGFALLPAYMSLVMFLAGVSLGVNSIVTLPTNAELWPLFSENPHWQDTILFAASLVFILYNLWHLSAALRRKAADAQALRRYRLWIFIAMASGFVNFLQVLIIPLRTFDMVYFLDSTWTFAFPLLVTFAVLKHQLFGLELRVKRGISKGVLAGAFVATFLVITQLCEAFAQEYIGGRGWVVGAVASGLLLFVVQPLQAVANRVADRAMPNVRPVAQMTHAERVALYREWVEVAWRDGSLSFKEREMLEIARARLGLDPTEALRLERSASQRTVA